MCREGFLINKEIGAEYLEQGKNKHFQPNDEELPLKYCLILNELKAIRVLLESKTKL